MTLTLNEYEEAETNYENVDVQEKRDQLGPLKISEYPYGTALAHKVDTTIYEGQWHNDTMNGWGVQKWPDGSLYEGIFLDGKREIRGRLIFSNLDVYEGSFESDTFHGHGTYHNYSD